MPLLTTPIGIGATGNAVSELHSELAVVSGPVDESERTNGNFGVTTENAVMEFQERYGLGRTGTVDQATRALMSAVATYALEGNTPQMRRELGQAVEANPNVAALTKELARFEILEGNYGQAKSILDQFGNQPGLEDFVGADIVNDPIDTIERPEVPYPGNFYTYRKSFLDQTKIDGILRDLADLNPSAANGPANGPDENRGEELISAAQAVFQCLDLWQAGNRHIERRRYRSAVTAYSACQRAALHYFRQYHELTFDGDSLYQRLLDLIAQISTTSGWEYLWGAFNYRRLLLSLNELDQFDWDQPPLDFDSGQEFIQQMLHRGEFDQGDAAGRQRRIEVPLVALAFILVPLARAEANRLRNHFNPAIRDLNRVLNPFFNLTNTVQLRFNVACEFIELPFARVQLAQVLLAKADALYKARKLNRAENRYREVIDLFGDDGNYRSNVEGGVTQLQNETSSLLTGRFHPLAPDNVGAAPLSDSERRAFLTLGMDVPINTIESATKTFPGLNGKKNPHQSLLQFDFPDAGQTTNPLIYALVTEAQSRLLQLEAGFNYLGYQDDYVPPWRFQFLLERARYFAEHAKNAQREYLNFLNNAEREELQEITAAQTVELEKSNIRIETERVEQSRREEEAAKLSQELAQLQAENAKERFDEFEEFDEIADKITFDGATGFFESALSLAGDIGPAAILSFGGSAVADYYGRGVGSTIQQAVLASRQRDLEKNNLERAEAEANKAADVAQQQLEVAKAGFIVADLQRSAALLRHEFAVQSLNFLRNRTLNAELWYRLTVMIRAVADTYMRYAVELAFLAEQAYEFEADKRINVIRFDYDVSEVGNLLAADFLLRDLDTLEQDLIVNQRQRQQQVRYVLSMAREFPKALQELRDNNATIFSLRLEQLERRFPGLFNIRIGAVEVTPVAIMDPTRFSLEMTYLGSSQVRLKAQPDTPAGVPPVSPLNDNDLETFLFDLSLNQFPQFPAELDTDQISAELVAELSQQGHQLSANATVTQVSSGTQWRVEDGQNNVAYSIRRQGNKLLIYRLDVGDDWLQELADTWPVKIRVLGPETAIFSGLTRQDASAVFPFASTAQRGAFENLGAAAGWRIDMSMKENQVVPGTVADILITFTLSGYYDPDLRYAVDNARRRPQILTQFLSARQRFADAFYEFNQNGRMIWDITERMLSLEAPARNLRNLGIILLPGPNRCQFDSLKSTYTVELDVAAGDQFEVLTPIPEIAFSIDRLEVTASVEVGNVTGDRIFWDFGEGDGFQNANNHTYNRPGKYSVGLRLVRDSRLYEYEAELSVSRTQTLSRPLTAFPSFENAPQGQSGIQARTNVAASEDVTVIWRVDRNQPELSQDPLFDLPPLPPGKHVVRFTAIRNLQARIYSQQRFMSDQRIDIKGLRVSTNRVFELDGTETTGAAPNDAANALTAHIFPEDPQTNERLPLTPVDRWTLELPVNVNPFLQSVTTSDNAQVDLGSIEDAIMMLDFETGAT